MKPVEFLPEADAEILDAATWYAARSTSAPVRFLDEVEDASRRIAETPNAFPVVARTDAGTAIRRVGLRRFPFSIIFIELDAWHMVLAVAHQRRRPLYWLKRAKKVK